MCSLHVARDLLPAAAGRAVALLHAVAPVHLGLVPGLLRAVVRQRHVPARHLAAAARVVTGGSVPPVELETKAIQRFVKISQSRRRPLLVESTN